MSPPTYSEIHCMCQWPQKEQNTDKALYQLCHREINQRWSNEQSQRISFTGNGTVLPPKKNHHGLYWKPRRKPKQQGLHTYPLLVQFHELLCDFGCVEGQAQALHVELWDHVFQHLFQRQSPGCRVLGRGGNGILQDRPPQRHELQERQGLCWGFTTWDTEYVLGSRSRDSSSAPG